jgi:hypothetical protein
VLAAPLVRFTLEQRQCQSSREEPCIGQTCQMRCMRQQRAGELLLIRSTNRQSSGTYNTQHTLRNRSAAAQQRAPTWAPIRSSITSANCASMARSRVRRDQCGIVGPSRMASRTYKAAEWRMSAGTGSSCDANDSILRGHNQSRRVSGVMPCACLSSTSALCSAWSRKKRL